MPTLPPCSACGLPFSSNFVPLAGHARHGIALPTHLCPRCTHGMTGAGVNLRATDIAATYRTRVYDDHEDCALGEDEAGQFPEDDAALFAETRLRRVHDLVQTLALIPRTQPHRVLHVGSQDGRVLEMLAARCPIAGLGIEPWRPWCEQAKARGVQSIAATAEQIEPIADDADKFDVIVEHHLLEHLAQPRAHLRHLRTLIADDGILIIEVPNLLRAYGPLESRFLQEHHRQVFTPRSLATMCIRAGWNPIHLDNDSNMRIFCHKAAQGQARADVPAGASADEVFSAVWANEVRLTVKRALSANGPTAEVLELIERTHVRCAWAPGRADIALEAAIALERENRYDEAAAWMRQSLHDRPDAEVAAMLRRTEWIIRGRRKAARRAVEFVPASDTPIDPIVRPMPPTISLLN